MVGLHRPVFGGDRGALDQRQQVALHALAGDRAAAHVGDRDLVDLVEEDDAVRLGVLERGAVDVVGVEALVLFLLDQFVPGVGDAQLALLARLLAHRLAHHVGEVDHADLAAHAGDLERRRRLVDELDLDLLVVHADCR